MTHRRAVLAMVLVTLLWSIAGVVSRQLESARGFEVTFWRSLFTVLSLALLLRLARGPGAFAGLRRGGRALWASSLCWSVMFTAFMLALTLTTVANVLVTMSLAPLFTALVSRATLGHRLPPRTWAAIGVAGAGIAWMYGADIAGGDPRHLLGTAVALCVPVAAAVNWALLQRMAREASPPDMLLAVGLGAALSALATLAWAWPFQATGADLAWLALLGAVQLAVPCLIAVTVTRVLKAPEVALLALLEVVFGVLWAWLGAGEVPTSAVLTGGALVLGALAAHEALALRAASPSARG